MNPHKTTILKALVQMRGDDLERATMDFSGFTMKQMQEQHGQSGKTRAQILKEYQDCAETVENATKWVRENL